MKIILLGPPGAGKGTIAKALMQHDGSVQISTGDILRAAIADGTELGKQVEAAMAAGNLVTDELIMGIMEQRLQQEDCQKWLSPRRLPENYTSGRSIEAVTCQTGRKTGLRTRARYPNRCHYRSSDDTTYLR
eukprot:UN06754